MTVNPTESFRKIQERNYLYAERNGLDSLLIKKASYDYRKNNLVIVLGAGASVSYGLPTWNKLIKKIFLKVLTDSTPIVDEIHISYVYNLINSNNLIAANQIRNIAKSFSDSQFLELMRATLYEDLKNSKGSSLYNEIINLDSRYIQNETEHTLDSIITYNYDNTLQSYFELIDKNIPIKTIYKSNQNITKGVLPIYHVHGYLPFNETLSEDNKIVLQEGSYHEQYFNLYRWNNLIQYEKYLNKNCLFVGVSLLDPNLRRLLNLAKKNSSIEETTHYIFKKKMTFYKK